MRFYDYSIGFLVDSTQKGLFIFITILFSIFLYLNRKKGYNLFQYIVFASIFIYAFLVISVSFFPLREIAKNYFQVTDYTNYIIPLSSFGEIRREKHFGHFLMFIPIGIFTSFYIKSIKKILFIGLGISAGLEIIQFVVTQISIKFLYGTIKIFNIDTILFNILGFLLGIFVFYILKKIFLKFKRVFLEKIQKYRYY